MTLPWHQQTLERIMQSVNSDRPGHAWLLKENKPDLGLDLLVKQVIASVFGIEDEQMMAMHPDLIQLFPQGKLNVINVTEAREASIALSLTPARAAQKLLVIHGAQCLNVAAANALLKTIEEPPAGALIILTQAAGHRLLPTISSRCLPLVIDVDFAQASAWLQQQDHTATAGDIDVALEYGMGSPLKALDFLKHADFDAIDQIGERLELALASQLINTDWLVQAEQTSDIIKPTLVNLWLIITLLVRAHLVQSTSTTWDRFSRIASNHNLNTDKNKQRAVHQCLITVHKTLKDYDFAPGLSETALLREQSQLLIQALK